MEDKYRKAVFIVVYRKTEKGIRYLIMKRMLHWVGWEFPKGGIKYNEEIPDAVKRELKEETGQFTSNIQDHNFYGKYKYDKKVLGRRFIGQTFSLYSAEIKEDKIKIDEREHSDYLWLPYLEAYKKLNYKNQKKCLEIVNNFLEKISEFRQFKTSSGKLVLAGKDAKNNEKLIKQIESDELVFHTAKPGSPFVNIKDKSPSSEDLREAAIFCAAKSQDWRDNESDVKVNSFKGKNILKRKDEQKSIIPVGCHCFAGYIRPGYRDNNNELGQGICGKGWR